MSDNFYVTLPSNVKSFSNNKISNFKTKLASRLILHDDWEVGLVEMSYTYSWYNISTKQELNIKTFEKGLPTKTYKSDVFIKPGRYDTIQELIDAINNKLVLFTPELRTGALPNLGIDKRTGKVNLRHGIRNKILLLLDFSPDLCHILGFENLAEKYGKILK